MSDASSSTHDGSVIGSLNLSSSCTPCLPLQFADPSKGLTCTACAAGEVARGDHCEACPTGSIPGQNNECTACPAYQISQGSQCVTCRFGEGADPATNTCVDCKPDAVLDWSTLPGSGCAPEETQIPIPFVEAANDNCPGQTWVEVNHLDAFRTQKRDNLDVRLMPEKAFTDQITQSQCAPYNVHLQAYSKNVASDPMAWGRFDFVDADGVWGACGQRLWCDGLDEMSCTFDSVLSFSGAQIASAGDVLRFDPRGNSVFSDTPTPLRLVVTGSRDTTVGCEPE